MHTITKKKVNINAIVPIRDVEPPIYGTLNNIEMSTGTILRCLCKRAIIHEVLPDGTLYRLNMSNYYTDNTAHMKNTKSVTEKEEAKPTITTVHTPTTVSNSIPNDKKEEVVVETVKEITTEEEVDMDDDSSDDDSDTDDETTSEETGSNNTQNINRNRHKKKRRRY